MPRDRAPYNMANENVPTPAPIRSDDQMLTFSAWVPIGKSNYLDEDWFILDANLLRVALEITPIDQAHQFESPPLGNAIMDFVNKLGYTAELYFVSRMAVNNLYQPWRAILLTMLNSYGKNLYKLSRLFLGGKKKPTSKTDQSKKPATAKQTKLVSSKQSKPATAKQPKPKPVNEKSTKPTPLQKASKGKVRKVQNVKSSLQLVDKPDEEQAQPEPEPEPQGEQVDYDLQRGITQKLPIVKGKGKGIATDEHRRIPVTEEASTGPSTQPEDDTSTNIVRDTLSPTDVETGVASDKKNSEGDTEILNIGEEQGEDVADKVNLEEKTAEIDEGQAGSDPGKPPESRPPPERVFMEEDQARPDPGQSHVALAGPDPEPMHDDFVATVYPQVHESVKHPDEEHVHVENPLSSTGTLSSMKNLDAYTFVPPLSTLVIDFTPPKPVSSTTQAPTFTSITETTTTTLPPPPPQQQSTADPALASRISALETDLPHKIDKTVNEAVKEAVQVALQALLRERFRDLSKADMTKILRDQMFESGSYKSQPKHVALYEALEASMERDNRDAFLAEKDKSHKRRWDDQDPPPPPSKEPDQSKKKKHESDASGSIQSPTQTSSSWKTSGTRDAPSSSSKQKSASDTDDAHLPTIKPTPDWLKPVSEEERPETLEPDWAVPPNDLPKPENNWANAFSTSYKDPEENKLLQKISDMGSFIKWFCRQIGKSKLSKAHLEGPAYKVVRAFHSNSISLKFQMEECHLLLTDQIDLVNPEGHRVVPDVSKPLPLRGPPSQLNASNYPNFGLEELVPSLWIESKREYDISVAHGISHWWFKRKEFYINRHSAPFDYRAVRSLMRILSVITLKTISSKLNHLSGSDKVNLFNAVNVWIRNIMIRKHVKDLQLGIKSYQTKLNLTESNCDASDFLFKEDYTIVSKPRAVIYRVGNDQNKMTRETEVHKFSDGTFTRILEKLDHMVKDFKLFKYNPGMEIRIWSENDRRRSKEFMEVIEGRLKIRSLKSFVSGRLRDVEYRLIKRTK
ncbi:hypothetical protein Tco_1167045 [Tanacetum coccineum]